MAHVHEHTHSHQVHRVIILISTRETPNGLGIGRPVPSGSEGGKRKEKGENNVSVAGRRLGVLTSGMSIISTKQNKIFKELKSWKSPPSPAHLGLTPIKELEFVPLKGRAGGGAVSGSH